MKIHLILASIVFVLVLVAAGAGVFYTTPGAPFEFTTVRGEVAMAQGSGLYRYDPVVLVREGVIWDAINLFVGLPLFALAIFLAWRGSLRGRLLLAGLLFYWFYTYLMLMTMYALNALFLVYVAVYALSAVAFFINLNTIDVARLPGQLSAKFPRRGFIGYAFVVAALLIFLWTSRLVPILLSGVFPPELAGMVTLETQGFDLGMVVPLMICTGVLLWRRSAWGTLLAAVAISYGGLMSIVLPAWIAVPLLRDGTTNWVEAAPFSIVCILGLGFAWAFFKNVSAS